MSGPKSKAEAINWRYRKWRGSPSGSPYDPNRCAESVPDGGRSVLFHQCLRKNGHGPEGLYCKQHAKRYAAHTGESK